MAILEILTYPNDVLNEPGKDIDTVDDDTRKFIDDLADTMYHAHGVGLAAPQVGDLRRICVIDTSEGEVRESREELLVLVNPKIVEKRGTITWEEGCLSFPDLFEKVDRARWVKVEALDRDGNPIEVEGTELEAVCMQHEIDHLDGVVFIDRMSRLKRKMGMKRYKRTLEAIEAEQASDQEHPWPG